jgi:hypothetical protein
MSTTHTLHRTWIDLADEVAELVALDDPRLGDIVLSIEAEVGCSLGAADRAPVMLARRFARAMRRGLAAGLEPGRAPMAPQPA